MSRLRVLHAVATLRTGGAESFVLTMMKAMEGRCESQVFSLLTGQAYDLEQVDSYCDEGVRPAPFRNVCRLARHLRRWRPHIIHMHMQDAMLYGYVASAISRVPVKRIAHRHGVYRPSRGEPDLRSRNPLMQVLHRRAVHTADALVGCSQAALDVAADVLHHAPAMRFRLYNPVNVPVFRAAARDDGFRERIGARDEDFVAIFLGRLDGVKGLDVLCRAFRLVAATTPLRVALVGPAVGDDSLQSVSARLALPEEMILTGAVSRAEVPGILKACDCLIQPSRRDAFPLTIIEAMAAGLPVIATRVGGIPEAVEDGVTGLLVPPEDPEVLAEAVRWMIEHPEERDAMGVRGRQRAEVFDAGAIADQLHAIYEEVLSE